MTVYIVEDEAFQLEDMLISLETLKYEVLGYNSDPFEAHEQIIALRPDVVLIDIHLNGKKSGIILAKRIKESLGIPVIFTTSETNKVVIKEAAEVSPITYLTKPINDNDLLAALLLAETKTIKDETEVLVPAEELFVKNGNKLVKIVAKDILYIHTDTKNYCTIVTKEGKRLAVRNSILGLHKILNQNMFIQTHRSYILNLRSIDFFNESDQTVDIKGHTIPVGRTFKQELYKKLNIV